MSIGNRIKERRREIRVAVRTIAAAAGVSPQAVYQWESGNTKNLKGSNLVAVARVLRVTERWLSDGSPPKESPPSAEQISFSDSAFFPLPDTSSEYLELEVSGVVGMVPEQPPERTRPLVDRVRLHREWIGTTFHGVSAQFLKLVTAFGDAMAPTFSDGDALLMDLGLWKRAADGGGKIHLDNGVYLFQFDGRPYLNRLQFRPDNSTAIISDNKKYETVVLPPAHEERLVVMGRVLWIWAGNKP